MTAATFSDVLASLAQDGDRFHVEPSEDWRQGRTLFGGLSACLAVRSAQRAFPQLPPLRSAQFAFIGPVTGAMFLTPILLRAGKSATFIQVEGKTETNTALSATLVFGAPRQSSGQDYLVNFALQNFYFRVVTSHDILRHNGISIGKREYLGFGPE